MPNWCNNTITIKGSTETVKQLWDDAVENNGLLSAIAPLPKILENTTSPAPKDLDPELQQKMIKETGFDNWYDWQVANWGTKWDIDVEGLEFTDHGDGTSTIAGWFDSAWSPPIEAYQTLCDSMDGIYLEAFYDEPGMCFVGCWDSEGGDDYYEYTECTSKTVRDTIPEYLVDHFELDQRMAEWEDEEEVEHDNA